MRCVNVNVNVNERVLFGVENRNRRRRRQKIESKNPFGLLNVDNRKLFTMHESQ